MLIYYLLDNLYFYKTKDFATITVRHIFNFENTEENITAYWMRLVMFVFLFALLAMITLEFIDKDKR